MWLYTAGTTGNAIIAKTNEWLIMFYVHGLKGLFSYSFFGVQTFYQYNF